MSTPRQEPTKYILDGKTPKQVELAEWGQWFETANRTVARTTVREGVEVSTVFIGIHDNFSRQGSPILFVTMIFGGPLDHEQECYATWEEAEAGHAAMVKRVQAKTSE